MFSGRLKYIIYKKFTGKKSKQLVISPSKQIKQEFEDYNGYDMSNSYII
jgi:hypothetical protein